MENHAFTKREYFGENRIGDRCHIYELLCDGKSVHRLLVDIDGEEENEEDSRRVFNEKCELIMDIMREQGI